MLVQQGKSAVIAMQFEITDTAAKAFAEELYYCLIDRRYPIDAAVAEARIAMLDINQIEFATPVLFLRPGFVDLFDFKPSRRLCTVSRLHRACRASRVGFSGRPSGPRRRRTAAPHRRPTPPRRPAQHVASEGWLIGAGVGVALLGVSPR